MHVIIVMQFKDARRGKFEDVASCEFDSWSAISRFISIEYTDPYGMQYA